MEPVALRQHHVDKRPGKVKSNYLTYFRRLGLILLGAAPAHRKRTTANGKLVG